MGTKNAGVGLWPFHGPSSRSAFCASYPNTQVHSANSSPRTATRGACVPSFIHDRITDTCNLATQVHNIAVIALFSESATIFNVQQDSVHPGSSFSQMFSWIICRRRYKHSTPKREEYVALAQSQPPHAC
ncbi:jg7702 [Pararge aegeria aegeria]|uniref:Jg7702 protein n=1 Tax=Pararge aegeria aegeria TaxID=348720 RepID=A0A8S4RB55_9NEOP|nr:jg7702 [Pararge aegeria aegeria]